MIKFSEWREKLNDPARSGKYILIGKALVFSLLCIVAGIVAIVNRHPQVGGVDSRLAFWIILALEASLLIENAVKMWALRKFSQKITCYVADTLILLVLTYFTEGSLISTLYIIILSEFYLSQKKLSGSIAMGACSIVLFLVMFAVSGAMKGENVSITRLVASAFNDLLILSLHFLIFNFALQIHRRNVEIAKVLEELNMSNEKLRKANAELKAVTQLEERQRIAKDIHDTAGHSITTVIMQTEAAKLVIDEDPEDAKRKLAAANLQAKHALEELRESVHLLSGVEERLSLKEELLRIVQESTDGTGIAVRYEIADIALCDAKRRFIANTLKEGISNGLRHGGATAFWLEVKLEKGIVSFLLSDNGKGMMLSSLKEGFGLSGMHTRAAGLGGTVWFETEPDEGFEIHLTLPADEAD